MTRSRSDKIASILKSRRPLATRIEKVQERLADLAASLQQLQEFCEKLPQAADEMTRARLAELRLSNLYALLGDCQNQLRRLHARFTRDRLAIGVIGRARQGKSRLLQSLTGLTGREIPDGSGMYCTGVRSAVYHEPGGSTRGEVWFHTEQTFLQEVLRPYYDELHLGAPPATLAEFGRKRVPPLPEDRDRGARAEAMHEYLVKYHRRLPDYRPLLHAISPRPIGAEEIREYVAQHTLQGRDDLSNYLAVREMRIYCSFPRKEDVGRIVFIDMPGLGDTGAGDEQRLIEMLGRDIDFVLFVRRPQPGGDAWGKFDVELYDTAAGALRELPLNLWSFLVINWTRPGSRLGDNRANCDDLAGTLREKHIEVHECAIADCSNEDEVGLLILDPVLDYLAATGTDLDARYAASCQGALDRLRGDVEAELQKARRVLGEAVAAPGEGAIFRRLFDEFWQEITTGLERLLRELRDRREVADESFDEAVRLALEDCRQNIALPSVAQINACRDQEGGFDRAYATHLDRLRTEVSRRFLALDPSLGRSLDEARAEVAGVLTAGPLGRLTPERGPAALPAIRDHLPQGLRLLPASFLALETFTPSYRGLVHHRIRKQLDGLTPDLTDLRLSSPDPVEVANNLREMFGEALYKVRRIMQELLLEPSLAAFAVVEEFMDGVLRAEGARREWEDFLDAVRSDIWRKEFDQLAARTLLRRRWEALIGKVGDAIQPEKLRLLN
jgi:hypothetical protein